MGSLGSIPTITPPVVPKKRYGLDCHNDEREEESPTRGSRVFPQQNHSRSRGSEAPGYGNAGGSRDLIVCASGNRRNLGHPEVKLIVFSPTNFPVGQVAGNEGIL